MHDLLYDKCIIINLFNFNIRNEKWKKTIPKYVVVCKYAVFKVN